MKKLANIQINRSIFLAALFSIFSLFLAEKVLAEEFDSEENMKFRNKCIKGNHKACDNIPVKKAYPKDIVRLLRHNSSNPDSLFNRDLLYTGQSFKVVQKVPGGYLFSPNATYFRSNNLGVGFLKTKKTIKPQLPFCAWFFYTGSYSYIGLDGFQRSIPAFRLYNGKSPKPNPYCNPRLLE